MKSEKGSAVLEFSISLFFITVLMVGVIDVGNMINDYLALTQIAREGTRVAASKLGLASTEVGAICVFDSSTAIKCCTSSGCSNACGQEHFEVQQRVFNLIQSQKLSLQADSIVIASYYCQNPVAANPQGDKTKVQISARYEAFFPLFNGNGINVSEVGPYLY
ncbi:MAG: pilus assembly protein [Deltaproteobacteria bacterium]|nr:pilus assembly protein [Deltaproteobacteria bacterium]